MKLSLLIPSRRNDKFISKILMSVFALVDNPANIEVLVMAHKKDEWNKNLFYFLRDRIKIFYEDNDYARYGLHLYLNDLAKHATGDWLWYLCSDHDIIGQNYDRTLLMGFKSKGLTPDKIHLIEPGTKQCGPMSHIYSRKLYEVMGRMSGHSHIDSYIGDVVYRLVENRVTHVGTEIMTDYTPRREEILSPKHILPEQQVMPPDYVENGTPEYWTMVEKEAAKINLAIKEQGL